MGALPEDMAELYDDMDWTNLDVPEPEITSSKTTRRAQTQMLSKTREKADEPEAAPIRKMTRAKSMKVVSFNEHVSVRHQSEDARDRSRTLSDTGFSVYA